jgi:hypothetical protein
MGFARSFGFPSRLAAVAAAVALVPLSAAWAGTAGASMTRPDQAAPGTARSAYKPPPIRHVWVIQLENEGFTQTFGNPAADPYLARTLPGLGALLKDYYAVGHHSLDNYIAEISGCAASRTSSASPTWATPRCLRSSPSARTSTPGLSPGIPARGRPGPGAPSPAGCRVAGSAAAPRPLFPGPPLAARSAGRCSPPVPPALQVACSAGRRAPVGSWSLTVQLSLPA